MTSNQSATPELPFAPSNIRPQPERALRFSFMGILMAIVLVGVALAMTIVPARGDVFNFTGTDGAGSGTYTLDNSTTSGDTYQFQDFSTADTATFNYAGQMVEVFPGFYSPSSGAIRFTEDSTAADATINLSGPGYTLSFANNSTAGSSIINCSGDGTFAVKDNASLGSASVTLANGVFFTLGESFDTNNHPTAGSAVISATDSTSPSQLYLQGGATLGNASVTISNGNVLKFTQDSSGGNAALTLGSGGSATLASYNGTSISIGSLAGSGTFDPGFVMLTIGSNNTSTIFSGTLRGAIEKVGSGTLSLTGSSPNLNFALVSAGTLSVTTSALVGSVDFGTIPNNATLDITQNFDGIVDGGIFGPGALTKNGSGVVTLYDNNGYWNGTTVNGGYLKVNSNSALGSGALTLNGGGIRYGAKFDNLRSLTIGANGGTLDTNGFDVTYASSIGGSVGSLIKNGAGALAITGSNSYSGGTILNAGSLGLLNNNALGSGAVTVFGGSIDYAASISNPINLSTGVTLNAFANSTQGGVISETGGSFGITKAGNSTLTLTATNTYTGATTINAGTLQLGNSGTVLSDAGAVVINGGKLRLGSGWETIGSLAGSGGVMEYFGPQFFFVGGNHASTTFAGVIQGPDGTMVKQGTGTLTLTGTNTYTAGTIRVDAGAIQLGDSGTVLPDSSTVAVNGGTFSLGAANETVGAVTLASGSIGSSGGLLIGTSYDLSSGSVSASLAGSAALVKSTSGTVTLTGANTYTGGTTVSAGTLIGNATSLQGLIVNDGAVTFDQTFNGSYVGSISGSGSVTKTGSGTLQLGNSGTSISDDGALVVDAGTLALGAADETVGSLSGAGGVIELFNGSARTLTINQSIDGAYAGVIQEGALIKNGSSNLTLSGANTYSGGTTINAGILALGADNSLADSGAVTINSGTFAIGSYNDTVGPVVLSSGSITGTTGLLTGSSYDVRSGSISANLAGSGALTKTTAGTVTLTGANTYSGGTFVNAGALVGNSSSLQGTISNNAQITFDQATNGTFNGTISGSGSVNKTGSGKLTLSSPNSYSGGTSIYSGLVEFSALNQFGSGSITLNGGGLRWSTGNTLDITASSQFNRAIGSSGGSIDTNGNNVTFSNPLSGPGVNKLGSGTLGLAGANNFTGSVVVNAGNLSIPAGASVNTTGQLTVGNVSGQTATATVSGGSFEAGATVLGNVAGSTGTLNVSSGTFDTGNPSALVVGGSGQGILNLSGGSVYASTITISNTSGSSGMINQTGGDLVVFGDLNVGDHANASLKISAGRTYIPNTVTSKWIRFNNGTSEVSGGELTNDNYWVSVSNGSQLTISGGLVRSKYTGIIGNGRVSVSGGTWQASDYMFVTNGSGTGAFDISGGVVNSGKQGIVASGGGHGTVTMTGGAWNSNYNSTTETFLLSGSSSVGVLNFGAGTTTGSLNTNGCAITTSGSGTGYIYFNHNESAFTFSNPITGNIQVEQVGPGTTYLTGNNSYSGCTIASGGFFALDRDSRIPGPLFLNGGGIKYAAAFYDLRSFTMGSNGATLDTNGFDTSYGYSISGSGSFTKSGAGKLAVYSANTYSGATNVNDGTLQLVSRVSLYNGNSANWSGLNVQGGATAMFNVGGPGQFTAADLDLLKTLGTSNSGFQSGSILGIDATSAGNFTFGNISDPNSGANSLGIASYGTGNLILAGSNTYSGGTIVHGGTIQIDADVRLGTGSLTMNGGGIKYGAAFNNLRNISLGSAGGSLDTNGFDVTYSSNITGSSGTLTKTGAGTLSLGAGERIPDAAGLTVNGGTLALGAFNETVAAVTLISGNVTSSTGVLTASSYNLQSGAVSAILAGSGALTKNGSGTVSLEGANTYTGGTTLNGGYLQIDDDSRLSSGPLAMNGGGIKYGAAFDLRAFSVGSNGAALDTNGFNVNLSHAITASSGLLMKLGAGNLTITPGALPDNSPLVVNGGGIVFTADEIIGSLSGAGGTTIDLPGVLTVNQSSNGTYSGLIQGNGSIVKNGTGALTLSGSFAGGATINSGMLGIGSGGFGGTVPVTINSGGTLGAGEDSTIGSLSGAAGSGILLFNNCVLTVNQTVDNTFAGIFSGGLNTLVKTGPATLTLAGTGVNGATVKQGYVQIDSNSRLGSGQLTLNGGGIKYGAAFNDLRAFTLGANGATLNTNGYNVAYSQNVTGSGALTKAGSGTLTLTGNSNYSGDTIVQAGVLIAGSNSAVGSGTVRVNGGSFVVSQSASISNTVKLLGGSYERQLPVGANLAGAVNSTSELPGGEATTAMLLGGQTSSSITLHTAFTLESTATVANDAARISDVYSFTGTGSDIFVLQLQVANITDDSILAWMNPGSHLWVNAIDGNTGNNATAAQQGFAGSFASFQAAYGGSLTSYVGAYGTDASGQSVWAVVNHNSEFAVTPEPSTYMLLLLGSAFLFARRRGALTNRAVRLSRAL